VSYTRCAAPFRSASLERRPERRVRHRRAGRRAVRSKGRGSLRRVSRGPRGA
jgi:hypothetical protein